MPFQKATKAAARLRLGIDGPSGSGKTYTSLRIATVLAGDLRVAVVDTERGSASKYSDEFDFDTLELDSFNPQKYIDAIHDAEDDGGYGALVIDSGSHAWSGKGGLLEQHDKAAAKQRGGNSWTAWRDVTPLHNEFVEAMVQCKLHLIMTLRSKTEHVQEKDSEGKTIIRKVGTTPIQRDGLEYEFDVFGSMNYDNTLVISKTRCSAINGGVFNKPGEELAKILLDWVSTGVPHEVRIANATAAWLEACKLAKSAGIEPKPLAENATVQQIERWTDLLKKKVTEAAEPVA